MVLQHCQKGFFFFLFFFKELAHTTGNNTECLTDQVRFIVSANLTQTQQSLLQKALHECKTTMHMYVHEFCEHQTHFS